MKKILNNKWFLLVVVLLVGFAIGKLTSGKKEVETHQHLEENQQIWTCSMHPQIKKDKPGKCPLCQMDLIPLDNLSDENTLPNEIQMSASAMKLAEIQTSIVQKQKPEKELRLLGKVKADERLLYSQTVHLPGRIERLYINFTGEKIYKGQKLASIYSPEFISAQKELFEVSKSANIYLLEAARNKLKQWKFSDKQIANLEKRGAIQNQVIIRSDYNGYVTKRHISEGDHVKEGQVLFEITDLRKVWVLFEAYENDLAWVKLKDNIKINFKALAGKTFEGKVSFIDPFIDPKTRVAYVRVELPNKKGLLKPNMFANGLLTSKSTLKEEVILIPKSAVLWTGKRAVVYVKLPNRTHNSFMYREVILGDELGGFYIIKNGLEEGEEVATHGVFKIDASAQLAGKKSMMNPTGGKVATGHKHGGDKKGIKIDKSTISVVFKKQLGDVITSYFVLKNKLANDNSAIQSDVKNIEKMLKKVDMNLVMNDAHFFWMSTLVSLQKDLKLLGEEKNINAQRKHFISISNSLLNLSQQVGVELNETLYVDFCPMANDNKGAYWLSTQKAIKNPYFGKSMLGCGEVKAVIK